MPAQLMAPLLAETGGVEELLTRVLPWLGALVVGLVVLAGVVSYYRRRCRRGAGPAQPPWTLQNLREIHARGDLEDDEYQRLRVRLLGRTGLADGGAVEGAQDSAGEMDGR
jgi:hypothetical protein